MKKTLFILILCVLVIPLMCCVPAFASFTNEWGEYGDSRYNYGFVHDDTANYDNETGTKITMASGNNEVQPILASFSFSAQRYLITLTGNYLRAYDVTKTGSTLYAEELIGSTVVSPVVATVVGGETYLLVGNRTAVFTYTVNSSGSFQLIATNNITTANLSGSGFKCDETFTDLCYFVTELNGYCDITNITVDDDCDCFTVAATAADSSYRNPALGDYDLDGYNELLWTNSSGTLMVARTQPGSEGLDTGFSTDGKITLTCSASGFSQGSNVILDQLNGGGHYEVIVAQTGYTTFTSSICVNAYYSDGSAVTGFPSGGTMTYSGVGTAGTHRPMIAMCDLGHTASRDICAIGRRYSLPAATYQYNMFCVQHNGSVSIGLGYGSQTPGIVGEQFVQTTGIACADMNYDGVDEIVTPYFIYTHDNSLDVGGLTGRLGWNVLHNFSQEGTDLDNQVTLGDVDSDNQLDVILSAASLTGVYFSSFVNTPPVLNNSLGKGGFFGYMNPACVDSTVTFQAQECGGTADCNFENDASEDTERIVTTCGISGNALDNGTFVGSNPTFDCVYNTTGTYNVRLYLQDDANPTDFSQYNTQYITLLVIDGIPGSTCDVPSSIVDTPSDQGSVSGAGTAYASDELSSVLDDLFGADTAFKNMIAIGIIIGVASSAAAVGGIAAGAIAAIAVTVLVMILGLLSVWIMVLLIALMLLGIVVSKMIFSSAA